MSKARVQGRARAHVGGRPRAKEIAGDELLRELQMRALAYFEDTYGKPPPDDVLNRIRRFEGDPTFESEFEEDQRAWRDLITAARAAFDRLSVGRGDAAFRARVRKHVEPMLADPLIAAAPKSIAPDRDARIAAVLTIANRKTFMGKPKTGGPKKPTVRALAHLYILAFGPPVERLGSAQVADAVVAELAERFKTATRSGRHDGDEVDRKLRAALDRVSDVNDDEEL